jgi:hypothetical protein
MPDRTEVRFLDRAGSERVAVRDRGGQPYDETTWAPIHLDLADMGQGASGRLARGYADDPAALRNFLDVFVDLDADQERERNLLAALEDNGADILRFNQGLDGLAKAQATVASLSGTLKAAENSKVEELAQWAAQLAGETTLLEELEAAVAEMLDPGMDPVPVDLDALATETGTNLGVRPAADHMNVDGGVRSELFALAARRAELKRQAGSELAKAGQGLQTRLRAWEEQQRLWQDRLGELRRELEDKGLKMQAGEIVRVSTQLNRAREQVRQLTERQAHLGEAEKARRSLLVDLYANRDTQHLRRRTTLRRVVEHVNDQAQGLRIHIAVEQDVDDARWREWLSANLSFRQPRVARVARDVSPPDFAKALRSGQAALTALQADGGPMLDASQVQTAMGLRKYPIIFELQTMRREDRVRIEVSEHGSTARRAFDHLSAGQQRSVLLSLLLSADRDEPLIVDQPEDHLDAQYIASSIVRQLDVRFRLDRVSGRRQ